MLNNISLAWAISCQKHRYSRKKLLGSRLQVAVVLLDLEGNYESEVTSSPAKWVLPQPSSLSVTCLRNKLRAILRTQRMLQQFYTANLKNHPNHRITSRSPLGKLPSASSSATPEEHESRKVSAATSINKRTCVCAHASCGCAIGYVYDRQTVSGVYVGRASWTALWPETATQTAFLLVSANRSRSVSAMLHAHCHSFLLPVIETHLNEFRFEPLGKDYAATCVISNSKQMRHYSVVTAAVLPLFRFKESTSNLGAYPHFSNYPVYLHRNSRNSLKTPTCTWNWVRDWWWGA